MEEAQVLKTRNPTFESSWTIRRRIIFMTLMFCAICVSYIMIFGGDTRVNESIVLGCFSLAGAVIASYVFGAVWDDKTDRTLTNERRNNTFFSRKTDVFTGDTVEPSEDRRKRAKARLERMRAKNQGVDNPDE